MATAADYMVGQIVSVYAFGHWYDGEVVKVGPQRVTVRYTSGSGTTRDKAVNPSKSGRQLDGNGPRDGGPCIRPF